MCMCMHVCVCMCLCVRGQTGRPCWCYCLTCIGATACPWWLVQGPGRQAQHHHSAQTGPIDPAAVTGYPAAYSRPKLLKATQNNVTHYMQWSSATYVSIIILCCAAGLVLSTGLLLHLHNLLLLLLLVWCGVVHSGVLCCEAGPPRHA